MVSRRIAAALVLGLLLAQGWTAHLAESGVDRRHQPTGEIGLFACAGLRRGIGSLLGSVCSSLSSLSTKTLRISWSKSSGCLINVEPEDPKLSDPEERARLVRVFERGLGAPVGFVLPLRRQWWQAQPRWASGPWPVKSGKLMLLPGDSPIGLRLPLDSLPHAPKGPADPLIPRDPMAPYGRLPVPHARRQRAIQVDQGQSEAQDIREQSADQPPSALANDDYIHVHRLGQATPRVPPNQTHWSDADELLTDELLNDEGPRSAGQSDTPAEDVIRTALCVEVRNGILHIFMPPVERIEDYLDLVSAIERTAAKLSVAVVVEGYHPPHDPRIAVLKVTPDPGVIEVNTQPSESWNELVSITKTLYEEARVLRLGTEKFDVDGKHTGTGGGNHVVIGAAKPVDSPFLRRPDLLKSMLGYWINHPSLSYLFSGRFIGPTSQAPRVDEGRRDALYELEMAFAQVPARGQACPPWLVDRLFRHLLVDLTGNTHRAEFCIDKMFSPDSSSGRLGLVELRGFEMPPHAEMSLTQQLLIRALIASFWEKPYQEPIVEWGTSLHDRFMLPYFVWEDFKYVIDDLRRRGFPLSLNWYCAPLRIPLSHDRRIHPGQYANRPANRDRTLVCAGRGTGWWRHRPLRGFLRREA